MSIERLLPRLFLVLLLGVLVVAGWQWQRGPALSADLMTLVPGATQDPLVKRAEQRMQEPLNREMLVLVGHADRDKAIDLARELAGTWQASGLFEKVQWSLQTDLAAVREQLLLGRLAMLSRADRATLADSPETFIQQRLQSLFDPFAGFSLVSSQDDWLGLTGRIQNNQPRPANIELDTASGALLAKADDRYWVLLRARTEGNAFDMKLPLRVADLLESSRSLAARQDARLLAASGLLYAANGQRQASHEMTWIGGGATLGILAILLLAFRRWRVLLAFVPVPIGMLFGTTACIALFGQMHVMTLVLGSSLIGVAVDYPLHFLSKSWSLRPWNTWQAVRKTLPGLSLSLATSCIGYLALGFTPFPALTQIAAFSAAGLIGAYLGSVCLLPALLKNIDLQPAQWPLRIAETLVNLRVRLLQRLPAVVLPGLLALFCIGGLWHLQNRNDVRQWVASPPQLQEEAMAVARITGYQPTSQFYLVRARDQGQLLERLRSLGERLDLQVAAGHLKGYMALDQLLASPAEQDKTRAALARLPAHWQPLLAGGVPQSALDAELAQLQALPTQTIDQVLAGPLGEAFRPLWLGADANGVAAIVSLQGLSDAGVLRQQAEGLEGVQLVDRLGELNQLFAATQVSAAELKLLSCALIVALLVVPFGFGGAVRIVALPLLAALCSLASLGWLGQPLTLFSLFGLLLVTAISVDYAILMHEQIGGAAVSLLGTLLAAVTTWLSFGLLAVSSTPAVSNFGLAVSLGLVFSFALAPWAAPRHRETRA
ncbi:MMPL family transporter [Pseudomonas sp. 148P]|uniref:MMPL family transporter n=1 Tax=Pseudomonas ulcerans TaxID=3115852 RepID=A0ABU7HMB8_9PSED|nr:MULTISPECIES: MMPL family transporter [unclassified Pseudomonas]MEE1921762.1 MMPL family transporter [Pseudomonas sp. 147P]MEE1932679.1 MMPL family transporter [Pseudomonas sp. 148P]